MATETIVDGSKLYSHSTLQAHRFPVSPLNCPVLPLPSVRLNAPAKQPDPVVHLKVEDVASTDVVAIAKVLVSMKDTLNQATKAFDFLAGDVTNVDDIGSLSARTGLEDQVARRITDAQEPREKLRTEGSVGKEVEDKVCHEPDEQISEDLHHKHNTESGGQVEYVIVSQLDGQLHHHDPLIDPRGDVGTPPKIPILLYEDASDDETDCYEIYQQNSCPTFDTAALFPPTENMYSSIKTQIALFDEPSEHEPPPPSPAPVAGPIRFLLRPMPTPEQSPTYVVYDTLPSEASSCCATPSTLYPRVPAPTPTTNESTFMVLPINSAPVSALTPNSSSSPLAPRDATLLFALSSEQNKDLLRHHDLDGFVVPTPMAAWPKTRTIVKTSKSLRASPLMVPPPLETTCVDLQYDNRTPKSVPDTPAETPVLFVPPPSRPGPRAGNSFADNLKLLPPLIII